MPIDIKVNSTSNDAWMNTRNLIQTMIAESNNDMKVVESLAAAMTYLCK